MWRKQNRKVQFGGTGHGNPDKIIGNDYVEVYIYFFSF